MIKASAYLLAIVLSLTSAFSVAAQPPTPAPVSAPAALAPALAQYRLGPGDKVRVITFGEESLTGEFFVSGGGSVSLPLVGDVPAAGLTTAEFRTNVENALKEGYLKEPKVSVEVLTYRPYYVLGEVSKPGEYPYTNGLTVPNAVATASGFTYRANTKKVFIKHMNETVEHEEPLTNSTPVEPGDTIRIAERYF